MIIRVAGAALLVAICAMLLRELGWRGVPIFCIAAALSLLSLVLPYFTKLTELFSSFSDAYGITESASAILKVVGISYLGGVTAEACTDLGAATVASAVNVVARLEIALIAIPFISEMLKLGVELIG